MRIRGRTLRPSTLAERRTMITVFGSAIEQHPEETQLADSRLAQLTGQELRSVLADWVHGQRVSARDRCQHEAQAVAKAAARSLSATGRRDGDDLVLDGPVVLGDLLRDRTMKHIGFVPDERELYVGRARTLGGTRGLL